MFATKLRSNGLRLVLGLGFFVWASAAGHQPARAGALGELIEAPPELGVQFPPCLSITLNETIFKNSRFKEFGDQLKYFSKIWLVFDGRMFRDKNGEPHTAAYRIVRAVGKDGREYQPQYFSPFPLFTVDDLSHTIRDNLNECKELSLTQIKVIKSRAMRDWYTPDYHWVFDAEGNRFRDLTQYFEGLPNVEITMTLPTGEQKKIPYHLHNLSVIKEIVMGEAGCGPVNSK